MQVWLFTLRRLRNKNKVNSPILPSIFPDKTLVINKQHACHLIPLSFNHFCILFQRIQVKEYRTHINLAIKYRIPLHVPISEEYR